MGANRLRTAAAANPERMAPKKIAMTHRQPGVFAFDAMLTLKRASAHRSGGPWDADDYDVYDGDRHIGRIMLHPQAPEGEPFWTITARVPQYPHDRGYAVSREQAMADFRARWSG